MTTECSREWIYAKKHTEQVLLSHLYSTWIILVKKRYFFTYSKLVFGDEVRDLDTLISLPYKCVNIIKTLTTMLSETDLN
jgi:hypothetical protein